MCLQLIHFLPGVGLHLSRLQTECKAGILMTAPPHLPLYPPLLPPLSSTPPPIILSTHTLHSVCSTDFLPPVSPPFCPPHLSSLPTQLHFINTNFPSTFLPLSVYPFLHLTSLYLFPCSVYHLPASSSDSVSTLLLLFAPCSLYCLLHFALSIAAAACHLSCHLPCLVFPALPRSNSPVMCELAPRLSGSQRR